MSDILDVKPTNKTLLSRIWKTELENAQNHHKEWKKEANTYQNYYRSAEKDISNEIQSQRYNIFWANTQTLAPLIFSKLPEPNITRRFSDNDKLAKIGSELMERTVKYFFDIDRPDVDFAKVRNDYLITGRGIARVYYDPGELIKLENEETEIDTDKQKVGISYVHWQDFLTSTEKDWKNTRWIAFRHYKTQKEIEQDYGKKKADQLTYETQIKDIDINEELFKDNGIQRIAQIWEIWDKTAKQVIWYCNNTILATEQDPYKLQNFFPIARPLGCDSDPDSILPIPLFRMYYEQAKELNDLDEQISELTKQIKFCGVYSSTSEVQDIEKFLNGENGEFNPLSSINSGDISKSIFIKPIIDIVNVVNTLQQKKQLLINDIREITGISDILRGVTAATETATAQRLKGNFAISRIQPLQRGFELFLKDTMELMLELAVENLNPTTLAQITNLKIVDIEVIKEASQNNIEALMQEGINSLPQNTTEEQKKRYITQLKQQAKQGLKETLKQPMQTLKGYALTPDEFKGLQHLLQHDKLRNFRINIETDSTIEIDQNQIKQERMEFLQVFTNTLSQIIPATQNGIISNEASKQILGFALRPFKIGRNIEDVLLQSEEKENNQPSIQEQLLLKKNERKDKELQLKAQEQQQNFTLKQEEINIQKAKVQLEMAKVENKQQEFTEKLEFEDANKVADRNVQIARDVASRNANIVERETDNVNEIVRNFGQQEHSTTKNS